MTYCSHPHWGFSLYNRVDVSHNLENFVVLPLHFYCANNYIKENYIKNPLG